MGTIDRSAPRTRSEQHAVRARSFNSSEDSDSVDAKPFDGTGAPARADGPGALRQKVHGHHFLYAVGRSNFQSGRRWRVLFAISVAVGVLGIGVALRWALK